MKPVKFVKTDNGLKNVSLATTLVHNNGHTFAGDTSGATVLYSNGEDSLTLFEAIKLIVKPIKNYSISLPNGGFIDPSIIGTTFISPKSGCLLVIGINSKPLCIFESSEFKDLVGLLGVLSAHLLSVTQGRPGASIQWDDFK